ncbi:MAG: rhomboid family intramembrane serine protease [Vicinamibacterales bacterium]
MPLAEFPWDELLPEAWHRSRLLEFQKKALVYGGLTMVAIVVALAADLPFQVWAPLIGAPGAEAAKHFRHWIEWRRENPTVRSSTPDQRRVEEQSTVELMAAAVRSRAFVTWTLLVCVTVPTLVQLATGLEQSVALASVAPAAVMNGEWWRLLSGTYLHGSPQHFLGNMSALLMYGAILESRTSRLRLPLVYLLACLGGSAASVLIRPYDVPSIGASGGVVGVIGYLFVFSRRQAVKFPSAFRGATATVFFGLIVAGALGFWYIDNAGHLGGALMGFLLAGLMVDTAQNFIGEPELPLLDLVGLVALLALVAGAAHTVGILVA